MGASNVNNGTTKLLVRPRQHATATQLSGRIDMRNFDFARVTVATGNTGVGRAGYCRIYEVASAAEAISGKTPLDSLSGVTVSSQQTHVFECDWRNRDQYLVFHTSTNGASASFSVTGYAYSGHITPTPTADQTATSVRYV